MLGTVLTAVAVYYSIGLPVCALRMRQAVRRRFEACGARTAPGVFALGCAFFALFWPPLVFRPIKYKETP